MPRPENSEWGNPRPRTPAPLIDPVLLWPTPNQADLLFFVERHGDLPANQKWAYGDPFPDRLKYPNHKLVYVAPQSADKWSRWYYASDRINEDEYNWTLTSGEQLIRTYFVRRSLYYERNAAEAAAANPKVNGEFTCPVVGTLDTRFVKYGFADASVTDAPEQLAGLYIIVQHRYIEPVTAELIWSEELQRNVLVTREIIPAQVIPTEPVQTPGSTVEIKQGNRFYDVRITQEVLVNPDGSDPPFPYEKPPIPDYRDYRFPSKLNSIDLVWVWAWADSTGAPQSYSEDFYFKYDLVEARPGPYSATIRRFITDNPEAIKAAYPLTVVPPPVRETMAVVYAWFYASQEGNNTQAVARESQLPPSIHGAITVTENGTTPDPTRERVYTSSYPATPGYTAFSALSSARIGYEVRELPMGLYEVAVIEIDITNLYG